MWSLTATPRSVGWEPRKPPEWFQSDGTSWLIRDDVGTDSEQMIMELASCLQHGMWNRARERGAVQN